MKKINIIILLGVLSILSVSLISADIIWDGDETSVVLEGLSCNADSTAWILSTSGGLNTYPTVASTSEDFYDCRDFYGSNGCCPAGCEDLGSTGAKKILGYEISGDAYTCSSGKVHCGQYNTSKSCESSGINIAITTLESKYGTGYCTQDPGVTPSGGKLDATHYCLNTTYCECSWNATRTVCEGNTYNEINCTDGTEITERKCDWQITDDNGCELGKDVLTLYWNMVDASGVTCTDKTPDTSTMDCGDITKLAVFTWLNVVVAVIILVIIYYIYSKKTGKKKKGLKKKKKR